MVGGNLDKKIRILSNLSPNNLITKAIQKNEGVLSKYGTLVITSREDSDFGRSRHTGRLPKDRFMVQYDNMDVDWADKARCQAISPENAQKLQDIIQQELNKQDELFRMERRVGADDNHGYIVDFLTTSPARSLFFHNQFRDLPVDRSVMDFLDGRRIKVTFLPDLKLDPKQYGINSDGSVIIDFNKKEIYSAGMKYCGEIKKSVFTLMNYLLPKEGVLPMHCSANMGDEGDTALFFGLSGTGKSTLSADPKRKLIGDDEHGWSERGIFNFEGGCYPKLINLDRNKEPVIYNAMKRFGSLAEHIVMDEKGRFDYFNSSITENTRGTFPLKFVNSEPDGRGSHPKNIFFLTLDAMGVIPPISKLDHNQAMYYFLTGYTSKVAGTEVGVTEPTITFSTGYGNPFLPLEAEAYSTLLGDLLEKHPKTNVWLINTGWCGLSYAQAKGRGRIAIPDTRAMVSAAIEGKLDNAQTEWHKQLNLHVIKYCDGIENPEILRPWKQIDSMPDYIGRANNLAKKFHDHFERNFPKASHLIGSGPRPYD